MPFTIVNAATGMVYGKDACSFGVRGMSYLIFSKSITRLPPDACASPLRHRSRQWRRELTQSLRRTSNCKGRDNSVAASAAAAVDDDADDNQNMTMIMNMRMTGNMTIINGHSVV